MSGLDDLPEHIIRMLEATRICDFVTISAKGIPVDTPTYGFPADDLSTIDLATGMPNPAKAERARHNPKVGLMMSGGPEEPLLVIRAHAAVHDRDLTANAVRYVAETGFESLSKGLPWSEARKAIEYWTRIVICNRPERIYWWDNRAALADFPHVWNAAPGTEWPRSDPAPAGRMAPSSWAPRPWRDLAEEALGSGDPAHLSVVDPDGYPLPMRALSAELDDAGFALSMPRGSPWAIAGSASLTFAGFRTFVGQAEPQGDGAVFFRVERALPQLPTTVDPSLVFRPSAALIELRRERLQRELQRRGASLPVLPEDPPPLTRIARIRMARMADDRPIIGQTEPDRG